MDAKLVNFSEITKLGSVKNRLCEDIFSLFGLFRLSLTLKRLGVEKQCGHSASEVIQALCMFKILGETVSSMYSVKFYELISIGKNCFYRMLSRSQMDWRRLLPTMAVHLLGILRRRDVDFYAGTSCFILDDTTVAKTTTDTYVYELTVERTSSVFNCQPLFCGSTTPVYPQSLTPKHQTCQLL